VPEDTPIVLVPGGFLRGTPVASFALGATPVRNARYAPFLETGRVPAPPWWSDPAFSAPSQPVVGVSWEDAVRFCEWLSETAGGRWRLPTETEWEHAMSGGHDDPPTPWGTVSPPAGEIPDGDLEGPWETGRGTPNDWGVLDPGTMVHEWCADRFVPAVPGPPRRASRGGSWRHRVRWSRPSARSSLPPEYRYSDYGFRVLREL
jgi:formylglycine-generating enzyme